MPRKWRRKSSLWPAHIAAIDRPDDTVATIEPGARTRSTSANTSRLVVEILGDRLEDQVRVGCDVREVLVVGADGDRSRRDAFLSTSARRARGRLRPSRACARASWSGCRPPRTPRRTRTHRTVGPEDDDFPDRTHRRPVNSKSQTAPPRESRLAPESQTERSRSVERAPRGTAQLNASTPTRTKIVRPRTSRESQLAPTPARSARPGVRSSDCARSAARSPCRSCRSSSPRPDPRRRRPTAG